MADKIDLKKKYRTRDGREVRIYATDGMGNKNYCVHGATLETAGWFLRQWDIFGAWISGDKERDTDLIEFDPYDHISIGDPVYVWNSESSESYKRYFAGVRDTMPCAFSDGATEWSSKGDYTCWDHCELAYDALPDNDPRKNQKPE